MHKITNIIGVALKKMVAVAIIGFITSFLFFIIIEFNPALESKVDLSFLPYYAQKSRYIADDKLVFVPKITKRSSTYIFNGDLFDLRYKVPEPRMEYVASYNEMGFRTNSSEEPFEVLVIGDSYIEIGESDANTFSEYLSKYSNMSTMNLGRSWYGPYQYNILLKNTIHLKPKIVVYCIFGGNDLLNIVAYDRWKEGKSYHKFVLSGENIFKRYYTVLINLGNYSVSKIKDSLRPLVKHFRKQLLPNANTRQQVRHIPEDVREYLGHILVGDDIVKMRFAYWENKLSPSEIVQTDSWKQLQKLISEFHAFSLKNDIKPLVVYIPTKTQVYGKYSTENSGTSFLYSQKNENLFPSAFSSVLEQSMLKNGISFCDLFPLFGNMAADGQLLYYPFDSHWNSNGRRIAARQVANCIKSLVEKTD